MRKGNAPSALVSSSEQYSKRTFHPQWNEGLHARLIQRQCRHTGQVIRPRQHREQDFEIVGLETDARQIQLACGKVRAELCACELVVAACSTRIRVQVVRGQRPAIHQRVRLRGDNDIP